MDSRPGGQIPQPVSPGLDRVRTVADLGAALRALRRRHARARDDTVLSFREIASRTGWSHGVVAEYFGGTVVPPTDRLDGLVRLLGATPTEQGAYATARDRVEENRRRSTVPVGPDGAAPTSDRSTIPRQLPADVVGFTGRRAELADLDRCLELAERSPTVAISAISGTAGVGKTALAVHWAHRAAARYPDGQLYLNLHGYGGAGSMVAEADALGGLLGALGVSPQRTPIGLDNQAALYRSLLAGRRMLVVLDNARDADQVRPLLPGTPTVVVLVTSRDQLTSLIATDGATPLTLDLLPEVDARELLARRLGRQRTAADASAVGEIIIRCARLPLALTIVAARSVTRRDLPLAAVAAELTDSRHRLNVLTAGDAMTDVRAVFTWSYDTLTGGAARLFRLLGLHPGPDISAAAAASLACLSAADTRRQLAELTRAHLITEQHPGRYGFHDLLRAYATELAQAHDSEVERHRAVHRSLDHYLHTAHTAARLMDPLRDPITLAPAQPGVRTENIADSGRALAWFTTERQVLLTAIEQAGDAGFDTHTWKLAWATARFLERQGHWRHWATSQQSAIDAAGRLGDRPGQASAHRLAGRAHMRLCRYDDADAHFRRALEIYDELADDDGRSGVNLAMAQLFERQGRYRDALSHAQLALDVNRASGNRRGEAVTLNMVGWLHAHLEEYQQSLASCGEALSLNVDLGFRQSEADAWDSLGYVHRQLGHHQRAVTCYHHALDLYRALGDRYYEALSLARLGDTHDAVGDLDAARTAWQQALDILGGLDHPEADQVRAKIHDRERHPAVPGPDDAVNRLITALSQAS
ncbi:MAG: hypothetical protein QOE03_1153 [Micromonosporaceae bacterium]|jgi:tetratricopeptide (TPR) repeat protein|nr:hypothetical protein [Micromonosporaceae bacterium]